MRIVIDLQGAQSTGSRTRGIGRYTQSLAEAIVRNRGDHEVILALSDLFPDTIEPIRKAFDGLLAQENIRVWRAPAPVHQSDQANSWRREAAELVRETFLESLNPSVVLVSSLFEGLVDDAVTSVGRISRVPTAVILYDLIPLINRHPYLDNPMVAGWYENKLGHLRRSDLLLAISESSRQEGIDHLGFAEEKIVNISTAADAQFQVKQIDAVTESAIRNRYGLVRSIVLYTGGIDHRKNIEGLIRAYSMLAPNLRQQHQLAIVCSVQPADKQRLEALAYAHGLDAEEFVLTGFVPEEDLISLYNICKLFVFPSWHEGFGLPALEAMSCGAAVIGANTSSLPEVIGCKEALFDPFDDSSIAAKLAEVLTNDSFREQLEKSALQRAKIFSWDRTAQLAIKAIESVAEAGNGQRPPRWRAPRPRLAYVSPLPPERSGISDYSTELLPELARFYDIEVVVAQHAVTNPWITANCTVRSVDWFRSNAWRFDRVVYHFGNSAFHQHMFPLLEQVPGIVVLHDFFLSGVVHYMDASGGRAGFFANSLYEGHGYAAVEGLLKQPNPEQIIWKYPCNHAVLRHARGVIAHSANSYRMASQWYGERVAEHWVEIPHMRSPIRDDERRRQRAREVLGIARNDFVLCSFGMLGPTKLNHRLLHAWLESPLARDERCKLVFVGENHPGDYGQELLAKIKKSGIGKRITITGWVDTDLFRQYLSAADVGVQLRALSRGETSGAVLDSMNFGLATIVNANGSMADLPDDGVFKIPDEFADAQLVESLTRLWQDENLRLGLGRRAQEIIRTRHSPRICAGQYFDAIENIYAKSHASLFSLPRAIARLEGLGVGSSELIALAKDIDRSIKPAMTQRQLLVDVSSCVTNEAKNDTPGTVLDQLQAWLRQPPVGYRVEPIYFNKLDSGYKYARKFTLNVLGCRSEGFMDDAVSYQSGDVLVGLDLNSDTEAAGRVRDEMRRYGVRYWADSTTWAILEKGFSENGATQVHEFGGSTGENK